MRFIESFGRPGHPDFPLVGEEKTESQLITAFAAKVFSDIESSGFTVLRSPSKNKEYLCYIANSTVMYLDGPHKYEVTLTAVKNVSAEVRSHVSSLTLTFRVRDDIDLPHLPSGQCRHGSIHKEVYPPEPQTDADSVPGPSSESGNAYFYKMIKSSAGSEASADLSQKDSVAFLKELLACSVDSAATRAAYRDTVVSQPASDRYFGETSILFWNRNQPGSLLAFFSQ